MSSESEPSTRRLSAEPTPEEAREFTRWFYARKWNQRKEERNLHRALKNLHRIRKLYPDVYKEVIDERTDTTDKS